ncbi:hypothetical protein K458DRAFT_427384 [Lentithecium fluviatile CBS 122367]|uniref:F-box domain-containing protein n=1 Tax=Lentithecium fluviatile CBS 122367 TaxID=1168545 RepID=A0A6G1JGA0_9PLEO|nr:hypothetical protein K458DRAFT_427384 [Lentithecium fluviatile CBS 122367]
MRKIGKVVKTASTSAAVSAGVMEERRILVLQSCESLFFSKLGSQPYSRDSPNRVATLTSRQCGNRSTAPHRAGPILEARSRRLFYFLSYSAEASWSEASQGGIPLMAMMEGQSETEAQAQSSPYSLSGPAHPTQQQQLAETYDPRTQYESQASEHSGAIDDQIAVPFSGCSLRSSTVHEELDEKRHMLLRLPPELFSQVAADLGDHDLLVLRGGSRHLHDGCDYAFSKRFFSQRKVETSKDSLERLETISNSRLGKHITSLHIKSCLLPWGRKLDPRQASSYTQETELDYEVCERHVQTDDQGRPIDVSFDLIHRIFDNTPNLADVVVDASTLRFNPASAADPYTNFSVLPSQDYSFLSHCQHAVFHSIFQVIRMANPQLRSLEIGGCTRRGPRRATLPPLAPTPLVLSTLLLDIQCYNSLQQLDIQLDFLDSALHEDARLANSFGLLFRQTPNLKRLSIGLADPIGYDHVRSARVQVYSKGLLDALATHTSFSLQELNITGLITSPSATLTQVIDQHSATLRHLNLDDVQLRNPSEPLSFFTALYNLELTRFSYRLFSHRPEGYLVPTKRLDLKVVEDAGVLWEERDAFEADEADEGYIHITWEHGVRTDRVVLDECNGFKDVVKNWTRNVLDILVDFQVAHPFYRPS